MPVIIPRANRPRPPSAPGTEPVGAPCFADKVVAACAATAAFVAVPVTFVILIAIVSFVSPGRGEQFDEWARTPTGQVLGATTLGAWLTLTGFVYRKALARRTQKARDEEHG